MAPPAAAGPPGEARSLPRSWGWRVKRSMGGGGREGRGERRDRHVSSFPHFKAHQKAPGDRESATTCSIQLL